MNKHIAVRPFAIRAKRWVALLAAGALALSGSIAATSMAQAANATCAPDSSESSGGYYILQFKDVGTCDWTVPSGVSSAMVLVVGGGGGGGNGRGDSGGGGGAGGQVNVVENFSLSSGDTIPVTVGTGGQGGVWDCAPPTDGEPSSFNSSPALAVAAAGGGAGGSAQCGAMGVFQPGEPGIGAGAGGLSSGTDETGAVNAGGATPPWSGYLAGNAIGSYTDSVSGQFVYGAGGGGAGSDDDATSAVLNSPLSPDGNGVYFAGAGAGGLPTSLSLYTFATAPLGGGGGGGDYIAGAPGGDGAGHGGCYWEIGTCVTDAAANSGGGGGGGGVSDFMRGYAGNGGSGYVVVAYSTVPSAPTVISSTGGNRTISVACTDAVSNGSPVTNYKYSTDNGGTWKALSPVDTTCPISFTTVSGSSAALVNGTEYFVRIRAASANGDGGISFATRATPTAVAPDPPTALSATGSSGSATISCTDPASDGGSAVTNYSYSLDGNTYTALSPVDASCPLTIPSLTNGTTYSITLKAINSAGSSVASSSVSVTPTAAATAPTAPTNVVVTPGNTTLSVACTNATNGGSAITKYQYTTDGGVSWKDVSPSSTTSCPVTITKTSVAGNTSLSNGTAYSVQLRAVNAIGNGAASSAVNGTPVTVPAAPTSLRATAGDQSASIACTAPSSNGGSAITGYKYSVDGGTTWVTASELACPVSITGLTNGTAYTVWLKATNSVGDSTSYGSTTVTPVALASAPVLTTATPGNTTASIAWTAPVSNGGMPITSYQYSLNGGTSWSTITGGGSPSNPLTISNLSNGTAYSVTLRAVTSAGQGPASNALIVTPRTVPAAPTGFVVAPTDSSAVINFVQGSNGGSAATDVEWSIDGGTTWISAGPGSTSVTVTNVDNGTVYTFKVRAKNVAGNGAVGQTTFTPRTVPAAPTGLSVSNGNGSATISFTPGSNGGSPITNYKYSIDGGTTWRALSPADASGPITISGLTNGTTYSIAIRAVNAAGDGPASELASATPRAPGNGGGSSATPTPSPSSSRSSSPSPSPSSSVGTKSTPTPTSTRTASPTPTPSSSVRTTGVRVFDDLSPIAQEIRNERDECDKSVTREVCNKETDERTKEAVDSTKEKSKGYIASGEKKVDDDKKDVDEKEKKSKDDDEKATKSEKDADEKDKKADASEKKAKDDEKEVKADKEKIKDDEKQIAADKREIDDDKKEIEKDKKELDKDEKKLKDDEKNKASKPVVAADKKEIEDDKKELEKDKKELEKDEKELEKDKKQLEADKKELEKDEKKSEEDHKTAEKDRKDADDADEKAKKDRDEADKSEKEAQDARDKLDKDEKELERAKEAEKRTKDLDGEHEKLSDADKKEQESEKEKRKALENLYPDAEIKYVSLCHATSSEKNPYVNVTVEIDAWVKKGHGTHNADIVPGVSGLAPMNMVSGVTVFENNCLVPEQQSYLETATPTPFVEPSVTATASASATPSAEPSTTPSTEPSATSSAEPSSTPSDAPSKSPSATPSSEPSATPIAEPSSTPSSSATPSDTPSPSATTTDTPSPTDTPSGAPSDSPTPTPSETVVPVTIPELIDEVTVYEDTSKEWHDTVIDNIILELEWIDEQANQGEPLPMPEELVKGLEKEKELKKKLDVLGDKLMRDGNNIVDPKASPELISAGHMMFTRVGELRASDLRLARDRAGLADEFPWWILWVAALALALGAGLWVILAYRRKRVYIDFDACTACGLCYEKFPELFAKGPGGKAIIRQQSQHSDLLIIDIPDRKHHDDLNDFVEQCKDGAIGYSRKVPREVKAKQNELNK